MSFVNPAIFLRRSTGSTFSLTGVFPDGAQGGFYRHRLVTVGGSAPFAWSIAAGALPPGLRIDALGGFVAGTVRLGPMTLVMSGGPTARAGERYSSQALVHENAPGGVAFTLASGTLPPGLTLDPNTGEISGVIL